jgi:P-type E1-E2 ATPase
VALRQADGSFKAVNSRDLVPGDIIQVPTQVVMPVDLILLYGSAICNEATLTGESIPVIKQQLVNTNEMTYSEEMTKHTVYAGTSVI